MLVTVGWRNKCKGKTHIISENLQTSLSKTNIGLSSVLDKNKLAPKF